MFDLPYRKRFAIHHVVGGNVLDQTILDAHHLTKVLFYDWSTEIDGEICFIVVSSSFPALCPVIFMSLLVVL